MFRFIKILIALILSISVVNIVYAQKVGVNSLRYGKTIEYSRMVFDLTRPVDYQVFLLDKPARLVIDLKGTKLLKSLAQPAKKHALLRRVRSATRNKNDLRIVVDLKAKVLPKSFTLKPNKKQGHRLVLDLFSQGAEKVKLAENKSNVQNIDQMLRGGQDNKNVELVAFANSSPRIRMYHCLNTNWQAIGEALNNHNFDIVEKNQKNHFYVVRYKPSFKMTTESSFWEKTVSYFGSMFFKKREVREFKVNLVDTELFTEVSIANKNHNLASTQQEVELLNLIFKGISENSPHTNKSTAIILETIIVKPENNSKKLADIEIIEKSISSKVKTLDGSTHDYYVDFVSFAGGIPKIRIENTMDYSWEIVERSLNKQPVKIIEINKKDAVFFVNYKEQGAYFWVEDEFKIKLLERGVLTEVFIFDKSDIPLSKGPGYKLLKSLYLAIEKSLIYGE